MWEIIKEINVCFVFCILYIVYKILWIYINIYRMIHVLNGRIKLNDVFKYSVYQCF